MNIPVDDYITYIANVEDKPFLRLKLFDVNMRLWRVNQRYRTLINRICDYTRFVALQNLDGYGQPFGISGANLGIPFNIVGLVHKRGKPDASCEILINPEILLYEGPLVYTQSNCGSLRLPESIEVLRYETVRVRYYTEQGEPAVRTFNREEGSYTVQHEVDHNLGILITDVGRIFPDEDEAQASTAAAAAG